MYVRAAFWLAASIMLAGGIALGTFGLWGLAVLYCLVAGVQIFVGFICGKPRA